MMIRIGIPTSFRRLTKAASDVGAPILVSANAFRRSDSSFRAVDPEIFGGCDVALDSAGFVAMFRYGGYPWTVQQYLDLVARHDWAWWAAMDFCCEPEIADSQEKIDARVDRTVEKFEQCVWAAENRKLKPCLPVLQGWRAADYLRCYDEMSRRFYMPPLLGLGSVCRRSLGGPAGLLSIIATLDRHLPDRHKLHLFGVKGSAVGELAGHPRIASIDSMAWDAAARRERGIGPSDLEHRIRHMHRWYAANAAQLDRPQLRFAV